MAEDTAPEPLRPPGMHDPSTVAVVQIEGRWYTRFTTIVPPEPRVRGVVSWHGLTYYMPHEEQGAVMSDDPESARVRREVAAIMALDEKQRTDEELRQLRALAREHGFVPRDELPDGIEGTVRVEGERVSFELRGERKLALASLLDPDGEGCFSDDPRPRKP